MAERTSTLESSTSTFYKESARRVMIVTLLSMLLSVVLASILLYEILNVPEQQFFSTSINGQAKKLYPLELPNQSDTAVSDWAKLAAISAYTYNFVDYSRQLIKLKPYFTANGWDIFLQALRDSNNVDTVIQKKLSVSAVPTSRPIILDKGILNGRYTWRVQMKMLITYQSASEYTQNATVVTMLINRVSTFNSPRGIGISQFIVGRQGGAVGAA